MNEGEDPREGVGHGRWAWGVAEALAALDGSPFWADGSEAE